VIAVAVIPLLPKVLVDQTNASYARAAGLEKKTIEINGYTVHFMKVKGKMISQTLFLFTVWGDDKSVLQTARFYQKTII
jgi:hypothetical protein